MRTLVKYELKEGESRVMMPEEVDIICATEWDGKVWIFVEVESDAKDFIERAFLVMRVGDEVKEKMILNYVGYAHAVNGEVMVVFEIL